MATLKSFNLNGKKLSFANWISNISPGDCLFTSMIDSEQVDQTVFNWQVDALKTANQNANKEGSKSVADNLRSTTVYNNRTQILRKVVCVSDTANSVDSYGRSKELSYQMEKASRELKRDIEWAFLNQTTGGIEGKASMTAGYRGLIAPVDVACPETGAVVNKKVDDITEEGIFDLTHQLYLAGSDANIIMFHPTHASFFSGLQENSNHRTRLFEDTELVDLHVSTIVDPLGQEFKLVPNRWMPLDCIYFFNPDDFTKMVLREPKREKLAKTGSSEKWMIEVELGLRVRHPFAAGMLCIQVGGGEIFKSKGTTVDESPTLHWVGIDGAGNTTVFGKKDSPTAVTVKAGSGLSVEFKLQSRNLTTDPNKDFGIGIDLVRNGVAIKSLFLENENVQDTIMYTLEGTATAGQEDAGLYVVKAYLYDKRNNNILLEDLSKGLAVSVNSYPAV